MKKSELKEMIKQAMLAESPITRIEDPKLTKIKQIFGDSVYDIEKDENSYILSGTQDEMVAKAEAAGIADELEYIEGWGVRVWFDTLNQSPEIAEAKEDEEEAEEVEAEEEEISVEDELEDEVEVAPEMSGDTAEVQDHLEAALEVAKSMGDEKLATQIKNTQIYLTRSQTVKEEVEGEGDKFQQLISALTQSTKLAEDLMDDERYDFEGLSMQLDTFIDDLSNLSESLAVKEEEDLYENKRILKIAGIIK